MKNFRDKWVGSSEGNLGKSSASSMLSAGVTFLSTKQIRLWDGEIPQAATRALEGLLRIIDTALPRRLQCGLSAAQPRAPSFPHNSKEKENSFVSHAPNPGM